MSSADWAAWLGAVGTVGALFVALYLLARDRQSAVRAQANQIAYWSSIVPVASSDTGHYVAVLNNSQAPILDVKLSVYGKTWWQLQQDYDRHQRQRISALSENQRGLDALWMAMRQEQGGSPDMARPLMPTETKQLTIPQGYVPAGLMMRDLRIELSYRDAMNTTWQRDVLTGRLTRRPYSSDAGKVSLGWVVVLVLAVPVFAVLRGVAALIGLVRRAFRRR